MKLRYEITQGDKSLGTRSFAATKTFALRCCLPTLRGKVVKAKRLTTLRKALSGWADVRATN